MDFLFFEYFVKHYMKINWKQNMYSKGILMELERMFLNIILRRKINKFK